MSVGLGEAMARPKRQRRASRPASEAPRERTDAPVRIDKDVVENAGKAARLMGKTLSAYLSELIRPLVLRDLKAEARKIADDKPER
jgi:hypothetical protein